MKKTGILRKINVVIYLLFYISLIQTFCYGQSQFELIHPITKESSIKGILFFDDQNHSLNLSVSMKNIQKPDELFYLSRINKTWSSSKPVTFHNWNGKKILCSDRFSNGIPLLIISGDDTNYDELFNLPEYLNEDQTEMNNFFLEGMNEEDIFNLVINNKHLFYSILINGKWIEPVKIPDTSNGVNPRLAIGDNENALILFYKDMDNDYKTPDSELFVSLYKNNYWDRAFQVTDQADKYKMNAQVQYFNGDYVVIWTSDIDGDLTTENDIKISYLVLGNQANIKASSKLFDVDLEEMSVPILGSSEDKCFVIFAGKNNINESDSIKSVYIINYDNQTFTEAVDTGVLCREFYNPRVFNIHDYLLVTYIDNGKLCIAARDNDSGTWYSCQSLFHLNQFNIDFSEYDYFIDQNAFFHLALIGSIPEKPLTDREVDIQLIDETTQDGIYYTSFNLLPDLTIEAAGTEPRSKAVGNQFKLLLNIKNSGYLSSGDYYVNIFQNGEKIKEISGQPLGPNENYMLTEIMRMEKPVMEYLVEVVTDTAEASVKNNRTNFSVKVLPDYSVRSVEIENDNIQVKIFSQKDIASPSVPVDLYCQVGDKINKIDTVMFNPNIVDPITINWPDLSGLTGEFRIIAEVNADRKIKEDTYLNNKSSYVFQPLPDFVISNAEVYEEKIVLSLENRGSSICDCTNVRFFMVSDPDLIEQPENQSDEDFYYYQMINFQDQQDIQLEIDIKEKLNPHIEKLYAVVNPYGFINEKNQNNNLYPVLVINKIYNSPEDQYLLKINMAQRIDNTVRIQLKNIGNKPVFSTQVYLYNGIDELIGKKIISVIKEGGKETVCFNQVPKDSYVIKVIYYGKGNRQKEIIYNMPYSFLIEAESLKHYGFKIEENESASNNQLVKTISRGNLIYDFDEKVGQYDIYITYYDENDGSSLFSVKNGWKLLDTWRADERTPSSVPCDETRVTRLIRDVRVEQGDRLFIFSRKSHTEYARIDCIEFIDTSWGSIIPDDDRTVMIEAEDMEKRNYSIKDVRDASNQKIVIADKRRMGSLEYLSKLKPGFYKIQINYFDLDIGKSKYTLFCNGEQIGRWKADDKSGSDTYCEQTLAAYVIDGVYIPEHAKITLKGISNRGERTNVDSIIFTPSFSMKKGGKK